MDNRLNWKSRVLFILGILSIIGICEFCGSKNHIDEPAYIKETKISKVEADGTFTVIKLKKLVDTIGIKHPEIVFAQARLETGNFKSLLFTKNNNLFGFRGKNGYIEYDHWAESVKAYKRFQDKYYKGGDYYSFLERIGYAEDSNYIKKVKSCVK